MDFHERLFSLRGCFGPPAIGAKQFGVGSGGSWCQGQPMRGMQKYPRLINRAMIVGGFDAVATRRKGPTGNAREDQQGIAPDGEGDKQDQRIVNDWSANEGHNSVEKSAASVSGPCHGILGRWGHWMFD